MRLALIGAVGLLLSGCPRRAAFRSPPPEVARTKEALMAHLARLAPSFESLRVRYQAMYEGERRQTFQLRVAALRDSLLWLLPVLWALREHGSFGGRTVSFC